MYYIFNNTPVIINVNSLILPNSALLMSAIDERVEEAELTNIGNDAELADGVEDAVPDADVVDALRHGPAIAREHLACIEPHLQHVVNECE